MTELAGQGCILTFFPKNSMTLVARLQIGSLGLNFILEDVILNSFLFPFTAQGSPTLSQSQMGLVFS